MASYINNLNALAARFGGNGGMAADPNNPYMNAYVNQRANTPYDPAGYNAWSQRGPFNNTGYDPSLAPYWGNEPGGWGGTAPPGTYTTQPTTATQGPPPVTPPATQTSSSLPPGTRIPHGDPPEPLITEEQARAMGLPTLASQQAAQNAANAAMSGVRTVEPYQAHQEGAAAAAGMNISGIMGQFGGGGGASGMPHPPDGWGSEAGYDPNGWGGQPGVAGHQAPGPDTASDGNGWSSYAHPQGAGRGNGQGWGGSALDNYHAYRAGQGWGGQQGGWGQPPQGQNPWGQPQPPHPNGGPGNTVGIWG